jgi:hypothetical protein
MNDSDSPMLLVMPSHYHILQALAAGLQVVQLMEPNCFHFSAAPKVN